MLARLSGVEQRVSGAGLCETPVRVLSGSCAGIASGAHGAMAAALPVRAASSGARARQRPGPRTMLGPLSLRSPAARGSSARRLRAEGARHHVGDEMEMPEVQA